MNQSNRGFDVNGNAVLFVFSIATERNEHKKLPDGNYILTWLAVSICDMAPEVVKQEPFHRRADVYYFGVRLWERFTRQTTGTTFVSCILDALGYIYNHKKYFCTVFERYEEAYRMKSDVSAAPLIVNEGKTTH